MVVQNVQIAAECRPLQNVSGRAGEVGWPLGNIPEEDRQGSEGAVRDPEFDGEGGPSDRRGGQWRQKLQHEAVHGGQGIGGRPRRDGSGRASHESRVARDRAWQVIFMLCVHTQVQ